MSLLEVDDQVAFLRSEWNPRGWAVWAQYRPGAEVMFCARHLPTMPAGHQLAAATALALNMGIAHAAHGG